MRVLVTRPEPDGERTAARLVAMGHEPHLFPALKVVYGNEPAGLAKPAGLVVTSANGARALLGWTAAADWRDVPLYAVGATSADVARSAGFTRVVSADGAIGDLADLVVRSFDPAAGTLLYPAARDRSGDFAGLVATHGIDVTTVEAYRADAAAKFDAETRTLLQKQAFGAVLVYSRRSGAVLAALLAAAGLTLARTHVVALSQAAAAPFRPLQTAGIAVAGHPDEAHLLAMLPQRH